MTNIRFKPIRLIIPKALTDVDEDTRLEFIHLLKYAKRLPKTLGQIDSMNKENDVWESNSDPMLAEAEDDFFFALSSQQAENLANLMNAMGLYEVEKAIDFPKLNELINRSKQERDKLIDFVKNTGKATAKQLAKIDTILSNNLPQFAQVAEQFIVRAGMLGKLRATVPQATVEHLMTVGAVIDRIPQTIELAKKEGIVLTAKQKDKAEKRGEKVEVLPLTPKEARAMTVASKRCGDKVVEVEKRVRDRIKSIVMQAMDERWTAKELEIALYDEMGDLNRDWRRVAITELAMAHNDAFLMGVPEGSEVWVPQLSGSCKYCKALLEGKVFKVLPKEPSNLTYDTEMKYLWPGKTNFGRKASTWVPCLPLHPNCRHRATAMSRFYAMKDGKPKLKTSIELIQEERARRGLPPDINIEATLQKLRKQWAEE